MVFYSYSNILTLNVISIELSAQDLIVEYFQLKKARLLIFFQLVIQRKLNSAGSL